MFAWWRRRRRRKLEQEPTPAAWLEILSARVPFFSGLGADVREHFLGDLKAFIAEKHFIGAKGMEITDEVRVVVAATAVRLTLHLDLEYYRRLTEIVVYPFDYRHSGDDADGAVFGEAHTWGTVVLSWPAVLRGLENTKDGHDTATHEFAHVLDVADGGFDGAPELRASGDYLPWAKVMQTHYDRLRQRKGAERKVLRSYGATNPAEFFAVATEAFFEKPEQMRVRTPDLYRELCRFYGFDPAASSPQ